MERDTTAGLRNAVPPARMARQRRLTFHVYVLLLDGDNYYVGLSLGAPSARIAQHGLRYGVAWSQLHSPRALIEVIDTHTMDRQQACARENQVTWLYMRRYGWKKVRGGEFSACDPEAIRRTLAARGFFEAPFRRERGQDNG